MRALSVAAAVLVWSVAHGLPAAAPVISAKPKVFLLDPEGLSATRHRLQAHEANLIRAWAKLEAEAREALPAGPFSVVDEFIPPGGTRHDYMSQAPYFWPNPETTNGLPYVRRDGERNPEIRKWPDHQLLDNLVDAVETLALAYYFKADESYAAKAATLLRAWFLDARTRMSPHLQFAQAIPGVNTGRGIGLIPYAFGDAPWPHRQLGGFSGRALFPLVRRAAIRFPDDRYEDLLRKLPEPDADSRTRLTEPGRH